MFYSWGSQTFIGLKPVGGATATTSGSSGIPLPLVLGIGAIALLIAFFVLKRRDSSEHVE
jgi:hypothetical protein